MENTPCSDECLPTRRTTQDVRMCDRRISRPVWPGDRALRCQRGVRHRGFRRPSSRQAFLSVHERTQSRCPCDCRRGHETAGRCKSKPIRLPIYRDGGQEELRRRAHSRPALWRNHVDESLSDSANIALYGPRPPRLDPGKRRAAILVVFGDHLGVAPRDWLGAFENCKDSSKGNAKMLYPPDLGIHGNSHMIMQDKNNLQIADLILDWIDRNEGTKVTSF